ncbi:hypothetical protein LRR81_10495 [Metabacillus sp. GX 13764]|uniref:hypothetical protein n=1 Tax=Metabacillus kandeliae TaxID=2900151 RepID=UPI001E2CDF36|nr:hypothetical protein [Metabacillus kandeliae]MCD7034670.1 hypothetical protein [Metabacillus kandeliae]
MQAKKPANKNLKAAYKIQKSANKNSKAANKNLKPAYKPAFNPLSMKGNDTEGSAQCDFTLFLIKTGLKLRVFLSNQPSAFPIASRG